MPVFKFIAKEQMMSRFGNGDVSISFSTEQAWDLFHKVEHSLKLAGEIPVSASEHRQLMKAMNA